MKLPNYEAAVVAEAKLIKYIFDLSHPTGKYKAAFFLSFGFSIDNWQGMAQALLLHAASYDVVSTLTTERGIHYAVEGELVSPDGRNPLVRTIWAIDTDGDVPRFITAYPLK